jgi:hypothetical protein
MVLVADIEKGGVVLVADIVKELEAEGADIVKELAVEGAAGHVEAWRCTRRTEVVDTAVPLAVYYVVQSVAASTTLQVSR